MIPSMRLSVDQQMLDAIISALNDRPHREVFQIIRSIEQQVHAHNEAQEEQRRLLAEAAKSGQMSAAQENAHREAGEL